MRKLLYIMFLFTVGFTVNDIQKEFIVLDWEIADEKDNPFGLTFNNAIYDEPNIFIPLYSEIIELDNPTSDFRITVENAVFEKYPLKTVFDNFNDFPLEVEIQTVKLKSGNEYRLQLNVSTVIRQNDEILILKSFSLKKIPVQVKNANISVNAWASNSVLKSGDWVKIKTSGKGIYKIPYSKLTSWGFSDPSKVNIFGSGGLHLSENPGEISYDDLDQCAVWHGQNNGVNCLFFYEPGNVLWEADNTNTFFKHKNHDYTDAGYFFLTDNVGSVKLAGEFEGVSAPATHQITDFDAYDFFEADLSNLISSGKNWYGEKLGHGVSKTISFNLTDYNPDNKVQIKVNAVARSYQSSVMQVHANSEYLGILSFSNVNTEVQESVYASEKSGTFIYSNNRDNFEVKVTYSAGNNNALSWLDFIEVNYRKKLVLKSGHLFFRDLKSVGAGNILGFSIESTASGVQVFDVTDVNNVTKVPVTAASGKISGKRPSGNLREYVAFNPNGSFQEPDLVGKIENQNLHGMATPEYLIITHPNFLYAANELAQFHRDYDGLTSEVVIADKIYNEFSSGQFNATAIRNFIKMLYDRGNTLKYVLLFGDGSYDNKNIKAGGFNFLPTYQSDNSLNPISSFITDDYFVILDNGETVYNGAVDLGIGRIPSSTRYQAEVVVSKIKNYHSEKAFGDWRNVLCFIADDGDGNLHLTDSENLSNMINENHKEFIIDKIYFDAFKQKTTTSGEEYPDVTDAINNRVADGTLILNYVGHANEKYLSNERVLDISHINSWTNSYSLPIFVTATCEFSRFDGEESSAGEYILFNPNGGGIGLFSTTRLVISGPNFILSRSFYNHVFQRDSNGKAYRMGDVMRLAKINSSNSINKRNFSLLADPALRLSYPEHKVVTATINQQDATTVTDTIGALQKITISGYITDYKGNKLNNFSGEISPTVFDKAVVVTTMGNHANDNLFPTPRVNFKVQENVLYKGVASVTNGEFTFSFIVPKDISYNIGKGKIVYYATNGLTDASGAFENFVIGGSNSEITDNKGPLIKLYLDSENFKPGDKTSKNPMLLAHISDENGINTTGSGIGHDITAVLDDDYSKVFVLNKYYRSNINDYTSGTIQFQFSDLDPGHHTLKLKAWDAANNSTEEEIDFFVTGDFNLTGVSCYPNPVTDFTYFVFEHNLSGATLDAIFEVFDIQGRRIDYFVTKVTSNGLVSNPVRWDLRELKVAAENGIYIFKVTVKNNNGLIASKSGKFVIVN
jgi:hypothetical protein